MKEYFELGKNLLLLLIVALITIFIVQNVTRGAVRHSGDAAISTSSVIDGRVAQSATIFATSTALVTRVVDGDTVIIEGGRSVRLLGMDTDEKGEPCFESAKDRLIQLVLDKQIVLERELRDGDIYGRLLRFIYLDGRNVGLQMVKEGLAVARASYEGGLYVEQFADAENYARQNHAGCKWK